jgi:hypothetical protein
MSVRVPILALFAVAMSPSVNVSERAAIDGQQGVRHGDRHPIVRVAPGRSSEKSIQHEDIPLAPPSGDVSNSEAALLSPETGDAASGEGETAQIASAAAQPESVIEANSRPLLPDFSSEERAGDAFSFTDEVRRYLRAFVRQGPVYFGSSGDPGDFGLSGLSYPDDFLLGTVRTRSAGNRIDASADLRGEFAMTRALAALVMTPGRSGLRGRAVELRSNGRMPSGVNFDLSAAATATERVSGEGAHASGLLGWGQGNWSLGGMFDRYSWNFQPVDRLVARDLPGTAGSRAFVNFYQDRPSGPLSEVQGNLSWEERDTSDGRLQRRRVSASGDIQLQQQIRLGGTYYAGPYRSLSAATGTWNSTLNDERYWSVLADFGTRASWFGSGLGYASGFLGGGDYRYAGGYWWAQPTPTTSLSVSSGQIQNFGTYRQTVVAAGWTVTPKQTVAGSFIRSYNGDAQRLTYAWRAGKKADVMLVFDRSLAFPERSSANLQVTVRH